MVKIECNLSGPSNDLVLRRNLGFEKIARKTTRFSANQATSIVYNRKMGRDSASSSRSPSMQDKQFQCVAQIVAINNPNNWFYDSCFSCHKKLIKDGVHQGYWCPNCRKWREGPVLWYYLALQVADIDNTATTEFKLFGKQAEHTVSLPNPHQYLLPPSLRALIGKVGIFTVKFELGLLHLGQVSFKVSRYDALPLDAQLPAQEAPPLPVPRRDIAESLPAQRQLRDEPDSSYPGKRPFIFSQGYYQARR
ncbi:Replication protein A DNA-binding subunit B [Carex littledalei]|uniref:Replication protein A DNA-binding subunit B n=1 Tax=Carex littledalei TaxID=544730 RepID=A0A833QQ81_9POAL|nr:Replication protein A DNA-binding subunit B [Carex littledalei]